MDICRAFSSLPIAFSWLNIGPKYLAVLLSLLVLSPCRTVPPLLACSPAQFRLVWFQACACRVRFRVAQDVLTILPVLLTPPVLLFQQVPLRYLPSYCVFDVQHSNQRTIFFSCDTSSTPSCAHLSVVTALVGPVCHDLCFLLSCVVRIMCYPYIYLLS